MTLKSRRLRALLCLFATATMAVGSASAQRLPFAMDMPIEGISSYDPAIPTPEDVVGHVIGTSHTEPYQAEAYFRAVARASDRVVVETHATSYEGRHLIHAVVTSPANHGRLEEIRRNNLLLSDDPGSVSDEMLASMPVVVYQGYSIHGNEASGTEAALLYLYHLAAGRGPAVEDALQNAVVLIDPMFNPDGRSRFTGWVNRFRGRMPVSDPQDMEHNEAWPGGRTNHYWFDLNRDWVATQHPESQGRMSFFHAWRPQLLTDHHEMGGGSTFFFQPGIPSRNNPNTPDETYDLTSAIAGYHAAELDRIGSLYYSEEGYDDFFYGKGSAYPDVNGAVGILFEQASSRALETETSNGVLHYAFTIRNQFAASLSTLAAAVGLRERLVRHQRGFYAEAPGLADAFPVKAWIVGLERGRTRAQALAALLQRHRIRIHELADDVRVDGADFHAGQGYVIPMNQPQFRLVKALMERTLTFSDSLFYDVSTWTLPLSHDVDYASYRRDPASITGPELGPISEDGGEVVGGPAGYAYLMPWNRYYGPRSVFRFMEADIPVRVMEKPFTAVVNGQPIAFERGTVVVPLHGRDTPTESLDPDVVHRLVREAAERDHTVFYSVSTGLTPEGPDLGGESSDVLEKPSVALLVGSGMSSTLAGEAWHLLSERFEIPVSLIDAESLARFDLSRYNVIVHSGGSLPDASSEALKTWIRSGGRVVLFSGAVGWARSEGLLDLTPKSFEMDSLVADLAFDQIRLARDAQSIGGSIFKMSLDTTHPLAYGMPEELPVFHTGSRFYDVPSSAGATVGVYADAPVMSGYISDPQLEQLRNSAAAVAQRYGRGRVVAFMDRLSFRAYWYGTQRLFMNAVLLSGSF